MRDAEYLIQDMLSDIQKMRAKFFSVRRFDAAMRTTLPALALYAMNDETHKYIPLVEGWLDWAEYYGMKGVVVPEHALEHHTKMIASIDSPIWDGIGLGEEAFAFAAMIGTRFTLASVDWEYWKRIGGTASSGRQNPSFLT